MKDTYSLAFHQPDEEHHYHKGQLPGWSRHPMSFAQKAVHFVENGSEFLIQRAEVAPFKIDLVEVLSASDFKIPFDVDKKQLFLYFMLEGSLLYTSEKGKPIARVPANNFLISCYTKGRYFASATKGKQTALVVTISPQWMEKFCATYPYLSNILNAYNKIGNHSKAMPQCRINRAIHRWLYDVYSISHKNEVILEGTVLLYLSYILETYNQLLGNHVNDPVYLVLDYLEEHFKDADLSNEMLRKKFHITERTLLKRFKEEFNTSPHQYYTLLRMQYAHYLLEDCNKTVDEVFMDVGYNNENAFRIAYNKYRLQNLI